MYIGMTHNDGGNIFEINLLRRERCGASNGLAIQLPSKGHNLFFIITTAPSHMKDGLLSNFQKGLYLFDGKLFIGLFY